MTTNIRTLRKIADRLGCTVYKQGSQWVLSSTETEPLHYSVTTERGALMVGLGRAADRDMLTESELTAVLNA